MTDPIAGQLHELQPHALVNPQSDPVFGSKGEIRWAGINLQLRPIMLEGFLRPAGMIPGGDNDDALGTKPAEQRDAKGGILLSAS